MRARRPWWPWVKRVGTLVVLRRWSPGCWSSQARAIDWGEVLDCARASCPRRRCWPAAALAACSFALYSSFDLLGRRYTGHTLRHRHGDGRHLHQLRLQPEPRLAGRRRRLPLPALFAAGPGQRDHHARARLQHADQLARLPAAGRRGLLLLAAGAAARLEDRQRRPAHARRRAAGAGRGLPGAVRVRAASTSGTCAATSCELPPLRMALLQLADVVRQLVR